MELDQTLVKQMPIKGEDLVKSNLGGDSMRLDIMKETCREYRQIMYHLQSKFSKKELTKNDIDDLIIWASNSSNYIMGMINTRK